VSFSVLLMPGVSGAFWVVLISETHIYQAFHPSQARLWI
jgi:hypothetical protein